MSVINETLINFEVYMEGTRLLGSADIELPSLEFSNVEVAGAGIAGKLNVPIQGATESLEFKLNWRTLVAPSLRLLRHNAVSLSAFGAVQSYDTAKGEVKITRLKVEVQGRVKSAELGKMEPASAMESSTTVEVDRLQISENDKNVIVLIDKYNFIYEVEGVDYLSEVRNALGL